MKVLIALVLMLLAFGGGMAVQSFGLIPVPWLPAAHLSGDSAIVGESEGEKKPLYWVAPMDKNYRRDKPGKSPMGMDLIPVYEDSPQGGDEGSVKISPVVMHNLGVRTAKVEQSAIDLPIHTVGYVDFDEDRLTHIHSRVDGWIEVLNVTSTGDAVKKGQTLYELYSPALVNAQEEYLAAMRSGNLTLKKASRSRLLSLGLSNAQIERLENRREVDQRIKVVAERDGFIKELNVRQGMFIKPATEVMSIGTLDTVWVIAEVFERQARWVKPGLAVSMKTDAVPGRTWSGTVDYLYPVLDNKTRTLRVRIRVDNRDFVLLPNMYADLTLQAPVAEQALSIPREAVIKGGRYHRVVKVLGPGEFKSVLVTLGVEMGGRIQILEGLSASDEIVTSAQFLIDSESNIDAEIARMEGRDAEGEPANNTVVEATGVVQGVMADMAMLSITHDPIPAWDWPTMKMDFQVAEHIDLARFQKGQAITFELTKTGEWDYLITGVKDGMSSANAHADHAAKAVKNESKGVIATGKVKELMLDMDMIEVVHDPIPQWQWPVMSMGFTLADSSLPNAIKAGDRIRFRLVESDEGEYLISDIEQIRR